MDTTMSGIFITLEGGEGCGKTTQSALLHRALTEAGIEALHTREPGGSEGAEHIRTLLVEGDAHRWDDITETLLFFAARRDHVEKRIHPAINQGIWVVCDRFSDSTRAYQGYGHGLDAILIENLHNLVLGGFAPNLTYLLDIDVEKGLARAQSRQNNTHTDETRFEQLDTAFHQRVREGFLDIAKHEPARCALIDASGTPEDVHARIIADLNQRHNLTLKPAEATEEAHA